MSRGFATVKGWLDIAEDAYCDGDRKTCEDMTREAYATFKLFLSEFTEEERRECLTHLYALKNLLNECFKAPVTVH